MTYPRNVKPPAAWASIPRARIKTSTPSITPPWQVIDEFRASILAAGTSPPAEIIPDGKLHRFYIEGHRRGSLNGAYVLHLDRNPAGWFQDFKSGVSGTWKAGGGKWHMDEATRREIEAERQRRRAEIEARHLKKAYQARVIWDKGKSCTIHPYLTRKAVLSHGLRVGNWSKWIETPEGWRHIIIPGALLVPMLDEDGVLWNLQAIFPEVSPELDRDKDFGGGRKAGLFLAIGNPTATVLIAEGYATAATLHEYTRHQTYVAFDAGNLKAVALIVRKLHPSAKIVVCADNDRHTRGNPGVTKAREAALAVGGLVSIPEFPEGVPGTDWNDLHQWSMSHGGR
jgi:putative DNA primase/helicase